MTDTNTLRDRIAVALSQAIYQQTEGWWQPNIRQADELAGIILDAHPEQPADFQLSAPKVGSAAQDQTVVSSSAAPVAKPCRHPRYERIGLEIWRCLHCEALLSDAPAAAPPDNTALVEAAKAMVDLHNGPASAKRPDVFQRRIAALAAALASREAKPGTDAVREAEAYTWHAFVPKDGVCATTDCGRPASYHFVRGRIGTLYCADCYSRILAQGSRP